MAKLLEGRSVLGFYQPHVKPSSAKTRTPSGPEIAGYYPPAVSEDLYYRALAARTGRKTSGGAKGKGVTNLFQGIGKCDSCGGAMLHLNKGIPARAAAGSSATALSAACPVKNQRAGGI